MSIETMLWILLAGITSGATGLGATLALPVLLVGGMPLAHALLVIKLPIALADLAAATSFTVRGQLRPWQLRTTLLRAAMVAALGAALLLGEAHRGLLQVLALIVLVDVAISCLQRRFGELAQAGVALYIAAIGCGAGTLLLAIGRFHYGESLLAAMARARGVGAAANLAALCVIALLVDLDWRESLVLAVLQAIGCYVGTILLTRCCALATQWRAQRSPRLGADLPN